jgi:hypothetical protein
MKNAYRILGVVACLALVWMVATGSNGCGIVTYKATVTIQPGSVDPATLEGAHVFGGGTASAAYHTGKLANLDSSGSTAAPIDIVWYALESPTPAPHEGVLTIVCTNGEHTHVPFTVDHGDSIPLTLQTVGP